MQNKKIFFKFLINSLIIAFVLINKQFVIAQSQTNEFKKIKNVTKISIKINKCEISKKGTDVGFTLKRNVKELKANKKNVVHQKKGNIK